MKKILAFLLFSMLNAVYLPATAGVYSELPATAICNSDLSIFTQTAKGLKPKVLKLALEAYICARAKDLDKRGVYTIIDFTLPSSKKRMWVIDMKTGKVLFHVLVAQGRETGLLYAKHFSDVPGTHESSVGMFLTGQTFYGNDGLSLRLLGLEKGFNDKAYARAIVIHGAWYVSERFVAKYHRLGRSWGCPAVSEKVVKPLIDTVKGGTLVFAYFPVKRWLKDSKFLHCGAGKDWIRKVE